VTLTVAANAVEDDSSPVTFPAAGCPVHVEANEDAIIEAVVREVNALYRTTTLAFALRVGRLIISSFYGGDLEEWRRRGTKATSFRKLARHPGMAVSPSVLYRSVAIYEMSQRLGTEAWQHISTTHMRLVLPFRPEEQGRLLAMADRERWSVSRFRHELAAMPLGRTHRGGRPSHGCLRKALQHIHASVSLCTEALSDAGHDLSPDSARDAQALLQRMQHVVAVLEQRVSPRIDAGTTEPSAPVPECAAHEPVRY
jgi:hypothetical protein